MPGPSRRGAARGAPCARRVQRTSGHDGDALEFVLFDVRDPPGVREAVLLALGWPGGQAPRAGALVAHMLDCMELSLAEDVAYGARYLLPGEAMAPVGEDAEAAATDAAAVADYLEALEGTVGVQEQWRAGRRAGALGGA